MYSLNRKSSCTVAFYILLLCILNSTGCPLGGWTEMDILDKKLNSPCTDRSQQVWEAVEWPNSLRQLKFTVFFKNGLGYHVIGLI